MASARMIQWDGSLALHIREIDEQHQKLIGLINDLHAAMLKGASKDALGPLLGALIDYTEYHFTAEEKLMADYGYIGTPMHKLEHASFVKKIRAFKAEFAAGKTRISHDLMTFLSDWLTKHILVNDKKYVAHLMAKGLS
jgi:hemerythrin